MLTGNQSDPSARARLWGKVMEGAADECWLWQGALNSNGYGVFKYKGSLLGAHRCIFVVAGATSIEDDQVVMHTCDNPPCCNPRHLIGATQSDNILDMHRKARGQSLQKMRENEAKGMASRDRAWWEQVKDFPEISI